MAPSLTARLPSSSWRSRTVAAHSCPDVDHVGQLGHRAHPAPTPHCARPFVRCGSNPRHRAAGERRCGQSRRRQPSRSRSSRSGERHPAGQMSTPSGPCRRGSTYLCAVCTSTRFDDALHIKPSFLELEEEGLVTTAWRTKTEQALRGQIRRRPVQLEQWHSGSRRGRPSSPPRTGDHDFILCWTDLHAVDYTWLITHAAFVADLRSLCRAAALTSSPTPPSPASPGSLWRSPTKVEGSDSDSDSSSQIGRRV